MKLNMLLTLSALAALSGCSASNDDLQDWMKSQSSGMKGQVTPLPPVAPFIPVAYIGRDMSDPFAPKKSSNKVASTAPDAKRKKDYLESFNLDRLSLVGTIKRSGVLWGLVKAPDGTITMVKNGDYMGMNFGKILAVRDSGIQLKESVLDPQGDWIDRELDFAITGSK